MRSVIALAALSIALLGADTTQQLAIDPKASKAQFSLQHIFVERVTGTIPVENGTVTLASGSNIPLSVTAVLDAKGIGTDDRDQSACIRGTDYFDSATFPTVTFASTKIVPLGPSAFRMDGSLTIHGVTRPEQLSVTISGDLAHPVYHATGQIDRHQFGMHGARLDPVIGGAVTVTLDIALSALKNL